MKFILIKITMVGVIAFYMSLSGGELPDSMNNVGISEQKKDPCDILKEIYTEVVELGKSPGDDFIKREFFVGEDDDDTNKDIHVLILIQSVDENEKITIQVTYLQRIKDNPVVRFARNVRNISCLLEGGKIHIIKSDYDEKENRSFLPEILLAIRNKKKLLEKLNQKK